MGDLVDKLDDFDGIYVDWTGRSSGLAMLWKQFLQEDLLSRNFNHVVISIKWRQNSPQWRFTGVYGFQENIPNLKNTICS